LWENELAGPGKLAPLFYVRDLPLLTARALFPAATLRPIGPT
jgi:hypothetical protein